MISCRLGRNYGPKAPCCLWSAIDYYQLNLLLSSVFIERPSHASARISTASQAAELSSSRRLCHRYCQPGRAVLREGQIGLAAVAEAVIEQ